MLKIALTQSITKLIVNYLNRVILIKNGEIKTIHYKKSPGYIELKKTDI